MVTPAGRDAAASPQEVLDFWYGEVGEEHWFVKDATLDAEMERRFLVTWSLARAGDLDDWAETADGALALVIVLDQFSRNMFRNDPRAFAQDARALAIADAAIAAGFDMQVPLNRRVFFYMPHEHSEDLAVQERCLPLMRGRTHKGEEYEEYARAHRDIIARFGRFPHRNECLGRESTAGEIAFLKEPGSSF